MPRKKTVTKTTAKKTPRTSIPLGQKLNSLTRNKPLVGAIGVAVIILLLLAFPFRFLVVPAIVNGQPIFSWQYVGELHKRAGDEIMTQMINQKLLEQEIASQNIQVSQAEVDGQLKKIEDQIGTQSGGLDAMLASQGMNKDELVKQIRFNSSLEKLVKGTITVADEEINKELEDNPNEYQNRAQVDAATTAAEKIRQQNMSAAFNKWFQDVKNRAKISNSFQAPLLPLPQSSSQ